MVRVLQGGWTKGLTRSVRGIWPSDLSRGPSMSSMGGGMPLLGGSKKFEDPHARMEPHGGAAQPHPRSFKHVAKPSFGSQAALSTASAAPRQQPAFHEGSSYVLSRPGGGGEGGKRAKGKEGSPLTDTFGRFHDYLRISLTERCNLRCQYCMPPEGVELSPDGSIMTTDEILRLVGLFVQAGVTKIRLTGGEPLIRPDIVDIVKGIGSHPTVEALGVTTNGITLEKKLGPLLQGGLNAINISLDTLIKGKFQLITRRNGFEKVISAIDAAIESDGFKRVKINCVVMRGMNDDEVVDFVEMTRDKKVDVRFIEYMPFGGNRWSDNKFVSYSEMVDTIKAKHPEFRRISETDKANDTSKAWKIDGWRGQVGFITSMSNHFCGTCNRLRLTADGNIKNCLFGGGEVSLRDAMRRGASDDELLEVVRLSVQKKAAKHGGHGDMYGIAAGENRAMIKIGG